jgi:isopenicillin N synthase-like dioxygenase
VLDEVIEDVRRDVAEFFKLPLEAKQAYVQLPESGLEGYGQAFVFSETQKLDWSDMLYLMVRPTESRDMRFWPAQPPSFRFRHSNPFTIYVRHERALHLDHAYG